MAGGRHPHPEAIYYHVSGDSLDQAKSENDSFKKAELIATSLVFSALCLETYINQAFYQHPETAKIIEANDHLPLEAKWLLLPLLLGASKTFDKGGPPYQTFSELVTTRNQRLVHFKPWSETVTIDKQKNKSSLTTLLVIFKLGLKGSEPFSQVIKGVRAEPA